MHNGKYQWQMPSSCTHYPPTAPSPSCSTRATQKAYLLTKPAGEFVWRRKSGERTISGIPVTCQDRAAAPGRRTREEIRKGSQMIALRFQRGADHQTPHASFRDIEN